MDTIGNSCRGNTTNNHAGIIGLMMILKKVGQPFRPPTPETSSELYFIPDWTRLGKCEINLTVVSVNTQPSLYIEDKVVDKTLCRRREDLYL